jgi:hypothetical protein
MRVRRAMLSVAAVGMLAVANMAFAQSSGVSQSAGLSQAAHLVATLPKMGSRKISSG